MKKLLIMLVTTALLLGMFSTTIFAAEKARETVATTDEGALMNSSVNPILEVHLPAEKEVTVNVGTQIKIIADGAKSYKSSKMAVATVDADGIVSTISDGVAKITVTLQNKKKLNLKITVVDPKKASEIKLDAEGTIYLLPGDSIEIEATMAPITAVSTITWKSSSKKVVSLSNTTGEFCTIKALEKGKTTITAQTDNKKKATFKIVVGKNKIDNIHNKPTASYIKKQYPGGWDMELKSIEILDEDKIAVECYLINGTNSTIDTVSNIVSEIYLGDDLIANAKVESKSVKCKRNSSKVLKFIFTGDQVDDTSINLTNLSMEDLADLDEYWDGYATLK